MSSIQEKLHILLDKLKETDHNLSVCVTLLQQYLRREIEVKHQQVSVYILIITYREKRMYEYFLSRVKL
ncbi:hypothetical protein QE152_g35755 [Popillia japonica]|uniref:Uncharacterized protein n=1 Tax=Popillia japonica TaxID=7064 RepID=A0AAW1IFC6_POPJA